MWYRFLFLIIMLIIPQCRDFKHRVYEANIEKDSLIYPADYQLDNYEYIPDVVYDTLDRRLEKIQDQIPMHLNSIVQDFIIYFTVRNRSYTQLMIDRCRTYFPLFEKYIEKYDLPDELKFLAIVESGLNPEATSPMGAVGLWQLMPSVAGEYGLKMNEYIDERQDPEKSTEVALRHLKWLYKSFDRWDLALAAYNSGYGNVRKAIRRSGRNDFWSIYPYLFRETRSYLPQFVALKYAYYYAEEHNFYHPEYDYQIKATEVPVNSFLNLRLFAEELNVCYTDLRSLNPHILKDHLPEHTRNVMLNVPEDKYAFVILNYDELINSHSRFLENKPELLIPSSDNESIISNQSEIIPEQFLSRWHQDLLNRDADKQFSLYPVEEEPKNTRMSYTVKYGESLWTIARQFPGTSVQEIKDINNLESDRLDPGQKLLIEQK